MYRIRRFNVVQTATTVAAIYVFVIGIFAVPAAIIVGVAAAGNGSNGAGAIGFALIALLVAVFYGAVGWVVTAIACAIYNLVSGWVGGVEIQLDPVAPPPPPPTWGPISQGPQVPPTPPSPSA